MERRVAVRAMIMTEDKLLCVRQKPYNPTSVALASDHGNGWWCLPGGKLELGESLEAGVAREIVEELGVQPQIGPLLYIQQFIYNDQESLEFFFAVTNPEDFVQINLAETSHGTAEIAEVAFIDPRTVTVLPKFLGTEDIFAQRAAHGPVKIISYPA